MGFLDFPRNVYRAMIDVPVHFVTHFTDDFVERKPPMPQSLERYETHDIDRSIPS